MKKLFIAFMLSLGSLAVSAQDDSLNDVRIVANSEFGCGEPIIAAAYYAPLDEAAPSATQYEWTLVPCDAEGNRTGAPVFSQINPGAPNGEDFVFPSSEALNCESNYEIGLNVTVADGRIYSTTKVVRVTSLPSCVSGGGTSFSAEPGGNIPAQMRTLSLISGVYRYTQSTSGNPNLVINLVIGINGVSKPQNTFFQANSNTPFSFSCLLNPAAQICTSETVTLTFFDISAIPVCSFSFTVNCKAKAKQTIVTLNSGIYYKGDDDHLHQMSWNGNGWSYQAITPTGGWAGVQIEGWLTGDPSVDRIFFKGKDGGLYSITLSNGSWILSLVGNGLFDVKSDVHMRGGEIIYIASDNLIHRRFWVNNTWNQQLISPVNGYQGVTAIGGVGFASTVLSNIFFRTSNNTIMNLFQNSGSWYSQFLPSNILCGGDMIFDDSQNTLYYRGTDANIHNDNWNWITGWAYNAMSSANGYIPATNNLAHTQGANKVIFKGTDGRAYAIWLQSNGQWRIDWLNASYGSVAGDLVSSGSGNNIFFTTTGSQIANYFFNGQPIWGVSVLNNSSPSNAISCSLLYRFAGSNEEENTNAQSSVSSDNDIFSVSPNPNNGSFTIQLADATENAQVELYNMMAERVDAFMFSGASYDFSPSQKLAPGLYMLRVTNNGVLTTKHIVIE